MAYRALFLPEMQFSHSQNNSKTNNTSNTNNTRCVLITEGVLLLSLVSGYKRESWFKKYSSVPPSKWYCGWKSLQHSSGTTVTLMHYYAKAQELWNILP